MAGDAAAMNAFAREFSYWKSHFSLCDIFSDELSYSLLFNNIRPDRVDQAMSTVGMACLPNYFLLVQVDNYQKISQSLEPTREYFQKAIVINLIRKQLEALNLSGFAANILNTERVICFIALDHERHPDTKAFFAEFVALVQKAVHSRTPYTLSVAISEECRTLEQYPSAYQKVLHQLNESFYSGIGAYIDRSSVGKAPVQLSLAPIYPKFMAAVSQNDLRRINTLIEEMFSIFTQSRILPQQVRVDIVRLIRSLEEYGFQCGVPEDEILALSKHSFDGVLSEPFLNLVQENFSSFCYQLSTSLERHNADQSYQFKTPMECYISEHFAEPLRLGDVAHVFGFSEGHLSVIFKQNFDQTFSEYLLAYRLERGKELLVSTGISVGEIAFQVGFNSNSYFCTAFKKREGLSPKRYREQHAPSNFCKKSVDE